MPVNASRRWRANLPRFYRIDRCPAAAGRTRQRDQRTQKHRGRSAHGLCGSAEPDYGAARRSRAASSARRVCVLADQKTSVRSPSVGVDGRRERTPQARKPSAIDSIRRVSAERVINTCMWLSPSCPEQPGPILAALHIACTLAWQEQNPHARCPESATAAIAVLSGWHLIDLDLVSGNARSPWVLPASAVPNLVQSARGPIAPGQPEDQAAQRCWRRRVLHFPLAAESCGKPGVARIDNQKQVFRGSRASENLTFQDIAIQRSPR